MKSVLLLIFILSGNDAAFSGAEEVCIRQRVTSPRFYQFEAFIPGRVYFKNGTSTGASLNYNYLHGAVSFLHANGDTLLFTNKDRIDRIELGENTFFSQQPEGEVRYIEKFGNVVLTEKKILVPKGSGSSASERKYKATSGTSSPSALLISNTSGEFQWQNNTVPPDYALKTFYYLLDQNQRINRADRATFMMIYGKERLILSKRLRENPVNFNDEAQLKELLLFCSTL